VRLDGFYTEHRRCGDLEASVECAVVWMARARRPAGS
jgi:hypothetical protein